MQRPGTLRLRRLALGLSMLEVATALGVSESMVSYLERGLRPSPDLAAKVETFLAAQERLTAPKRARAAQVTP